LRPKRKQLKKKKVSRGDEGELSGPRGKGSGGAESRKQTHPEVWKKKSFGAGESWGIQKYPVAEPEGKEAHERDSRG